MASKRMAISALLSDTSSSRSKPPSPAPAPTSTAAPEDEEPPHKRQRHAHAYTQQYYESYNAYPYAHSASRNAAPDTPNPPTHFTSASRASPAQWTPSQQQQLEDSRRYMPAPAAFDFSRQQREANASAVPDAVMGDEYDERWKQQPSAGAGESLVSVLTGQMRARQLGSASGTGSIGLPAPPQLRRDSQSQHHQPYNHSHSVPMPTPTDSPPMRSRDASPVLAKSTTPHTTPPIPSPVSAFAPTLSPTYAYPPRVPSPLVQHKTSESPTTTQSTFLRQNVSYYSRPSVSPTNAYPPHSSASYASHGHSPTSSYTPHTIGNFPPRSAPSPTQYTPISPCMQPVPNAHSHASPGTSPTTSYILPLRPPSRPASSRGVEMASPAPPSTVPRVRTPLVPPQSYHSQLPSAPLPPVLHLQPPPKPETKEVEPDEDRSFEDELLSLVDGDDVKPKILHPATTTPVPQVSPPKPFPLGRKTTSSSTPKAKPKAPLKSRVPSKSSKAKAAATAARHASGTSTPVPGSSMPPPSPSPTQPTKQQPTVARAKGKITGTINRKKGTVTARSRSLSVKPLELTPAPIAVEAVVQPDDRLYCLCKTPYEEEKIMIACDRCDEWYHPACVGMPEAEVDLVDQFICSSCSAQNPALHTTYKPRCHRGLNHIATHDTLATCWKPARGAFSKYCSEECGIAHMRAKIAQSGRSPAELWPAVKNARRREGVTISHAKVNVKTEDNKTGIRDMDMDIEKEKEKDVDTRMAVRKAMKEADEREMSELRRRLEDVMRAREECKLALERVVTRRRLLDLAVERAGVHCGWDARLEMGDNEWAGWVDTEEGRRALNGGDTEEEAEWWCQGPEACPRHRGWQTVRDHDVQLEVDSKNASIKQLTDRERELRHRIEDLDPPSAPLKPHGGKPGGRKKSGKRSTR